jgi:hypothetical protein
MMITIGEVSMSHREDLELMRAVLLEALQTSDVAVKAQVAGQLRAVLKDLAALGEPAKEVSAADEIAVRRQARRAGSDDSASSSRRGQSRRRGGGNRSG